MRFKIQRAVAVLLGIFVVFGCAYLAIFGRALGQPEDHLRIAFALPRAMISGTARVDAGTYLVSDREAFIRMMADMGFAYVDEMGSAYLFEKDGKKYDVGSRMYSSHFMLFSHPIKWK